jgi:hypothetical protein
MHELHDVHDFCSPDQYIKFLIKFCRKIKLKLRNYVCLSVKWFSETGCVFLVFSVCDSASFFINLSPMSTLN